MARTNDFIVVFNIITLILGLIVFALAVYVKQNFADGWASIISLSAVWLGIFGGLFMMMISCLGCYAAKKNKKVYLCIYLICVLVLLTIQIAAAVVLVNYSTAFKSAFANPSNLLTDRNDVNLNNAVLSAYTKCCSGCTNGCNNPTANAFFPGVHPYCYQRPVSTGSTTYIVCDQVAPCSASNPSYCYKFLPGDSIITPTHYIDQTLCSLFSGLSVASGPLVGYVDKGGCGGGKASQFALNVDSYFAPKVYLVGVAFAIIALVQSTVVFVSIYIIACVSKNDVDGDDYIPRRERKF